MAEGGGIVSAILEDLENKITTETVKEAKMTGTKPKAIPRRKSTSAASKQAPKLTTKKRKGQDTNMVELDAKKTKLEEREKVEEKEQEEPFVFSESMLNEFLTSPDEGVFTSTQVSSDTVILGEGEASESMATEEEEETEGNETVIEVESVKEKEMAAKIEQLIKTMEERETEVAEVKSKLEEKEKTWIDLEMIRQGTINSLEEEKKVMTSRLQRYTEAVPPMIKELHKMRQAENESEKTNTKTELNKLKKTLKESEEKIEKLTMEKTFFESEAKRNGRIVDNLSSLLQLEREGVEAPRATVAPWETAPTTYATATAAPATTTKTSLNNGVEEKETRYPDKKCYKFERGQCKARSCSFLHPTALCQEFSRSGVCRERDCLDLHLGQHKGDCYFWKQGSCKFAENECGRGLHRPEMLDISNSRKAENEVVSRKEQTNLGHGVPVPWAQASATNHSPVSFLGEGRANPLTELLRSLTTQATPPAATGTSMTTSPDQTRLLLQILAPMAPALLAMQGGRPGSQ